MVITSLINGLSIIQTKLMAVLSTWSTAQSGGSKNKAVMPV